MVFINMRAIFGRGCCRRSRLPRQCFAIATMLLLLCAENAETSDLSKITGIDINIPAGTISFSTPQPQAIPDMLKNLPTDVLELLNPYGLKLAFLIREVRAGLGIGLPSNATTVKVCPGAETSLDSTVTTERK